jgi:branched-chain amino acid aminotransferase
MTQYVWLNDGLVRADEARVTAFDAGFQHGVGLFETLRAYNGVPLLLAAHLARLSASAQLLGVLPGDHREELSHAVSEVLEANDLREARIRITLSAGALGQSPDEQVQATILIVATANPDYPAEFYQAGMTVTLLPFRQFADDPLAGHKTTCYFGRLLGLRQAQQANCQEAIWQNADGHLAEGCTSNLFVVRDGVVCTPPRSTPVLPGVTRAVVLELAKELGVPAEEASVTQEDLLGTDEAFLTNAVMGVMPLCRVERQAIGAGKPGDVTRRIYEGYHQFIRQETGGQ